MNNIPKSIASSTLIFSAHHRKSPPFEDGMKKLASVGFEHIWIFDTGSEGWGSYEGPYEKLIHIGISNIMCTLVTLWKTELPQEIERIVLIDNDCFIIDPVDTIEYVTAFIEEEYDVVTLPSFYTPVSDIDNNIILQYDLREIYSNTPLESIENNLPVLSPGSIAYCIWTKKLWKNMNVALLNQGDAMLWWEKVAEQIVKFGLHRMGKEVKEGKFAQSSYQQYSQFELDRWFHLGNLMYSYYMIEQRKEDALNSLHKGYFSKFFPQSVSYSTKDRLKYINIWNDLTGV